MKNIFLSILIAISFIETAFAGEYYYFYDHLGNVDIVTDETGEAVATYEYDPFGNTIEENIYDEEFSNDYKYTGQEEDDETGLYYYNARYYSPSLGRFMSQDPAVYDDRLFELVADPQSLNPYSYARNNPVKYVDPSGEYNVETGLIEEGDTREGIVDAVNTALGIITDWATIAEVSYFMNNFNTSDPSRLVGQHTNVGTMFVTDVTKILDYAIGNIASQAYEQSLVDNMVYGLPYSWIYSAIKFLPGGEWDIKQGGDRSIYSAYIYHGELIRKDASGNIAFGAACNILDIPLSVGLFGADLITRGGPDDLYDQKMIDKGFKGYYWNK